MWIDAWTEYETLVEGIEDLPLPPTDILAVEYALRELEECMVKKDEEAVEWAWCVRDVVGECGIVKVAKEWINE